MLSKIHLFIEIGLWSELVFVLTKKKQKISAGPQIIRNLSFWLPYMKSMKTMKRTILSDDFEQGFGFWRNNGSYCFIVFLKITIKNQSLAIHYFRW